MWLYIYFVLYVTTQQLRKYPWEYGTKRGLKQNYISLTILIYVWQISPIKSQACWKSNVDNKQTNKQTPNNQKHDS